MWRDKRRGGAGQEETISRQRGVDNKARGEAVRGRTHNGVGRG